jgi:hypothetical protein
LQTDALPLTPNDAVIVLPNEGWEARLRAAFHNDQDWQVEAYMQILGRDIAEAYREEFPWRVTCLGTPDPARGYGSNPSSRSDAV